MKQGLTVGIIGAGSSYTPELMDGFLNLAPGLLPVQAFRLFDTNAERLAIMTGLSERMIRKRERDLTVKSFSSLESALEGVDFVIAQIRVGGMAARYLDESIPLKYGIVGQETTGPGGMFKALRTIPAMLEIARAVERVAPQAFVLNYTNPSGIVTEAVTRHTDARFLGLCSGIPMMMAGLNKQFGGVYQDLRFSCVGLNHLGFIHRALSQGRDVMPEILRQLVNEKRQKPGDADGIAWQELCQQIGALPIGYLNYYFRRAHMVEKLKAQDKTRAQQIMEIEQTVFAEAAAPDANRKPEALNKRGGGGYSSITFDVMAAIHNNTGAELAISVPNRGAVEGLPPDEVAEVVCRIERQGATPLPAGPIPPAFRGLVLAVKAFEVLTVEAAITGERRLLKQALLNHPLVGDVDIIDPLLDEMIAAHGLNFR